MVHEIFAAYGTVQDSKVLVANGRSNDGQGQSVAIIRMGDIAEATWLVDNVNGNIPQGLTSPVLITYAGQRTTAPAPAAAAPEKAARYTPYGAPGPVTTAG